MNLTLTKMNTRLQQFLSAEDISQAQFADTIGVARASVSHILAGRNRPGYDFIVNTVQHYPDLNVEWLLTGKGKMYKSAYEREEPHGERSLFDVLEEQGESPESESEATPGANIEISEGENEPVKTVQVAEKQRNASKIIVFYDDGTFQEFHG